tara:strand:- start:195 stop:371 length:177 start_codon:yes stop_codon:yes gene_type:complete
MVALLDKDLAPCLEDAPRLGPELPVLELIKGFYASIVEHSDGRQDAAALIARFDRPGE